MAVRGCCVSSSHSQASSLTDKQALCFNWNLSSRLPNKSWPWLPRLRRVSAAWLQEIPTEQVCPMPHPARATQARDLAPEQGSSAMQGKQTWTNLSLPLECGDSNAPSLRTSGADGYRHNVRDHRRAPGNISWQALGLSHKRMAWVKEVEE